MKRKVGTFLSDVFCEEPYLDLRTINNLTKLANIIIVNAKINGRRYFGKQERIVHLLARHRHDNLVFNYKVRKNWSRVDVNIGDKVITIYVNNELLTRIKKYER